jgi:signal transduction histidine kinase/DNA-binding response OmpR family regulator
MDASYGGQSASINPNRKFARHPEHNSWFLVLLLLLFILPLAGGTYWMYFQSKQEIERAELQSDQLRARTLSAIVEQSFDSAENLLTSIANRRTLGLAWTRRDVVALKPHLEEIRTLEPSFLFVSVFEPDCTLRAIEPPDKIVGQNFAYRDWCHGVAARWQPYVSEVYRTAASSTPLVVAVAVPIRDERGIPDGIMMATYSLSQLASEFSTLDKGAAADFYVVDQHGVVAAARGLEPTEPVRLSASGAVARALSGQEGSGQYTIDGKNAFVGFAPIHPLGWAVLYARSESDALAPAVRLRSRNRSVGLYLLLVYLATAVLAGLLMRRQDQLLAANQSLNRELEKQSKFKDQFLSTMSHELRTPLNAVLGFSDLLTEERYGPLNDRQHRYVTHIHTGGKHLLRLINDILDLSKIEAGRLQLAIENVALKTAFAEVLDTMRPLADKKSQTLVQNAAELGVRADNTRFKQILMNLLGNAIKFTPEGGRIELSARDLGDKVRVEARDSGPGIPLEEQKHIFEAFYRLRQSGKAEGTGLGLAITQSLVELHGGELGLESQPGLGSCFYFTLASVAPLETNEILKRGSGLKVGKSSRILVIEDNHKAAHLLQSHLTSAGYDVVVCADARRAVELAAETHPSAITLDLIMKPVNGWELLASFKSDPRTSAIPIIIVTVVDQPATGALFGADEYIVKPVDKPRLLSAIDRCLNQSEQSEHAHSILVVEDDLPTREFIAATLTKHGHVVALAADGAEARAQVTASLPDLVVLDLTLPKVSGFQLLAEWRASPRTAGVPVFVLTNKDLTSGEMDYIRINATALFRKQERWQDALIKQLQRAVGPVITAKS